MLKKNLLSLMLLGSVMLTGGVTIFAANQGDSEKLAEQNGSEPVIIELNEEENLVIEEEKEIVEAGMFTETFATYGEEGIHFDIEVNEDENGTFRIITVESGGEDLFIP